MKKMRKLLALGLALLTSVTFLALPASAENGTAVINPVESNIAKRPYTTAVATSGDPSLVKDNDTATAWTPDSADSAKCLTLDFDGRYDNLRNVEVVFTEAGAHRYFVEASSDKIRFYTIADRSQNTESAVSFKDSFYLEGIRQVRITLLDNASVAEMRVYNYLPQNFIMGSDISYSYPNNNFYTDASDTNGVSAYQSVRNYGLSFVRLRVWNNPADGQCGVPDTLQKAKKITDLGMDLGLDFHYGDTWCDPGKQGMPKAWTQALGLPDFYMVNWDTTAYFAEVNAVWNSWTDEQKQEACDKLAVLLHDFTYDVVKALVDQGTVPKQIQIGNEITNGICWPICKLPWDEDPNSWQDVDGSDPSWDRFVQVLNAGTEGAKAALPAGSDTKFVVHTTVNQGTYGKTKLMFEEFEKRGLEFDIIGISYYPTWHGSTDEMEKSLNRLCRDFPDYDIQLSETAYVSSGNGPTGRPFPQPVDQFPMTVQGQANFLLNDFRMINDLPDGKGLGVLYWELIGYDPMYISSGRGAAQKYIANASMKVWKEAITSFPVQALSRQVRFTPIFFPPQTVQVRYSQGTLKEESVTWNAADMHDLTTLTPEGKKTVRGITESGLPASMVVAGSSFSAVTDRDVYRTDENILITLHTSYIDNIKALKLYNENGGGVGFQVVEKKMDGGSTVWTLRTAVSTAGNRTLTIKGISNTGALSTLATASFTVVMDAPAIVSASAPTSVTASQPFTVTVVTSRDVKTVAIHNHLNRNMGKALVSKTTVGNSIVWVYTMQAETPGIGRAFTVSGVSASGIAAETPRTFVVDILPVVN